jgi:colicin import membrane protein
MSIPVATALGRRDRSWPEIAVSVAVHAGLIAWALTAASRPDLELQQKPIVAKLVRLGEKRPQELLPRKSAPPQPVEAAPAPPAPAVAAAPPSPVPVPRSMPTTKPAPAAPAKPAPPPTPSRGSGASVASILAGARQQASQERWGAPDGDPMGDADEGAEGDRYIAAVVAAIKQYYRVPALLSDRERLSLEAKVALFIEPDGRLRWNVESTSGNGIFDDALHRTLEQTRRVPPPPEGSRERYRRGIVVVFTPRTLG